MVLPVLFFFLLCMSKIPRRRMGVESSFARCLQPRHKGLLDGYFLAWRMHHAGRVSKVAVKALDLLDEQS